MSTTSMAIFSNPLFATYSVYARNASIVDLLKCYGDACWWSKMRCITSGLTIGWLCLALVQWLLYFNCKWFIDYRVKMRLSLETSRTSQYQCSSSSTSNQWCGLRPPVLGQDWSWDQKIGLGLAHCNLGLGLAGLVFWNTVYVTLVVIMIFKDTATFQVLFIVSPFWSWNITTVEINSGVHLLES